MAPTPKDYLIWWFNGQMLADACPWEVFGDFLDELNDDDLKRLADKLVDEEDRQYYIEENGEFHNE